MRSQAAVPTTQPLPAALVTWASSVTEEAEPAQLQGSLPTALGVPGRGTRPREVGQGGGCWCRLRGQGPRQQGAGAESWRCPVGTGTGQASHQEPAAPRVTSPTGPGTASGLPSPGLDLKTYTLQVARAPGPPKWENLGSFWRRVPDEPADLCFPIPNTGSVVAPPVSSP